MEVLPMLPRAADGQGAKCKAVMSFPKNKFDVRQCNAFALDDIERVALE